jgi:Zn-dependent peptidase ImmA (M78 family)
VLVCAQAGTGYFARFVAAITVGVYDGRMPPITIDPEAEARQLLETAWAGRPVPVDPIEIARQLGIKVFTAGLEDGVAGMLVKRPARDPEMYINAADSLNRQRFTVAHELGHYVEHIAAGEDDWEHVDYRDALSSKGTNASEIFANQFAANLLMPRAEVERLEKEYSSPAALANVFGVSPEAISFRLTNLKPRDRRDRLAARNG